MVKIELRKIFTTAIIAGGFLISPAFAASQTLYIPDNYPKQFSEEKVREILPVYKKVSKEPVIAVALEMLKGTTGEFSRGAILGNNLSGSPMKVEFKDLGQINPDYANFDALGWKKGRNLFIYINPRHYDAPPAALAALLSHEALHQDEYNSLAEETYAWTMEAAVWTEISKLYPEHTEDSIHPLVARENTLKKLFIKGNYSNKYIKKTVMSNEGYKNLKSTSPGFEDL